MITHAEKENANTAIERIRKQFETKNFVFEASTIRVTASFGIAGFRGTNPPDVSALVARADTGLYVAKSKGRNRVEFAADLS